MSWLFCCGSSEAHKLQEKSQTLDLSKPMLLEAKLDRQSNQDLEGLLGKQTEHDQKLEEILK